MKGTSNLKAGDAFARLANKPMPHVANIQTSKIHTFKQKQVSAMSPCQA